MPNPLLFFFKTLILKAMKKQKLLSEENSILFINSTGIKVSPDANRSRNTQKQSIGRSKWYSLHLFCTASCQVVFHLFPGNYHGAIEGRKLIKSIYPKNNNYISMDRAYEYDKTIALTKAYGFHQVVPPKKNRKLPWLYDEQLYKQRNLIERFFLRLKCFRKVFTRYDKLDSIFIYTISLFYF